MNWGQLRTILWLRWRLSRNQWSRGGAFNAMVMLIVTAIGLGMSAAGGIAGVVLGIFVVAKASPQNLMLTWDGIITGFATFMTGETYALYRQHSLLARLAAEPEDLTGFDDGLEAATDERGLLNRLFQARTRVLAGEMSGEKVGPYLSGLLINAEIEGAFKRYGADHLVTLVADGVLAKRYVSALRARGSAIEIFAPERAFLDGLSTLAAAR